MYDRATSALCALLLVLRGCSAGPPNETTGHQVGQPDVLMQRSLWDRLTDPRGRVEGRITFPDGRPLVNHGIGCAPKIPRESGPAIGFSTNRHGEYVCGGKPGVYVLTVTILEGVEEKKHTWDLDVKANSIIRRDFTLHP